MNPSEPGLPSRYPGSFPCHFSFLSLHHGGSSILSPFPKFLTSPLTDYTSFLGASPFRPIPHLLPLFLGLPLSTRIPAPAPDPWGLLFPPGFPSSAPDYMGASSFLPDTSPCPGLLGGSTYFYCSGYKTQVFSGSLPHASLMIPVRQSLDKGQKVVCQKCAAIQRRVVATLGAVLNDRTGAGSFAARRTTNEEPP